MVGPDSTVRTSDRVFYIARMVLNYVKGRILSGSLMSLVITTPLMWLHSRKNLKQPRPSELTIPLGWRCSSVPVVEHSRLKSFDSDQSNMQQQKEFSLVLHDHVCHQSFCRPSTHRRPESDLKLHRVISNLRDRLQFVFCSQCNFIRDTKEDGGLRKQCLLFD